jgi:hypothetical protein
LENRPRRIRSNAVEYEASKCKFKDRDPRRARFRSCAAQEALARNWGAESGLALAWGRELGPESDPGSAESERASATAEKWSGRLLQA